jgi:hypothetical protein
MRVKFRCISAYSLLLLYLIIITLCIIILFLHLLSTNNKCTQPYYFPLLYKTTAQKVKMDMANSWMRSSRLALPQLPFLWRYETFHCSASRESS